MDIDSYCLHRFDPLSGRNDTSQLEEEIGCFALCEQGGFVAALRSGFCRIESMSGGITPLPSPNYDRSTTRFNDGRCDASGRFWAGTLYQPKDRKAGWLCCLEADDSVTRKAGPVLTSNGLAFSPDNTRLYYADTPEHVIYVYDFDLASGRLDNQRIFHRFPAGRGRPDGAAVDVEGCSWPAYRSLSLQHDGIDSEG